MLLCSTNQPHTEDWIRRTHTKSWRENPEEDSSRRHHRQYSGTIFKRGDVETGLWEDLLGEYSGSKLEIGGVLGFLLLQRNTMTNKQVGEKMVY